MQSIRERMTEGGGGAAGALAAQREVGAALAGVALPTVISTEQIPGIIDRCAVRRHGTRESGLAHVLHDLHSLAIPLFLEFSSAARVQSNTHRRALETTWTEKVADSPAGGSDGVDSDDSSADEHVFDDGQVDLSDFMQQLKAEAQRADAALPFTRSAFGHSVRNKHRAVPVSDAVEAVFAAEREAARVAREEEDALLYGGRRGRGLTVKAPRQRSPVQGVRVPSPGAPAGGAPAEAAAAAAAAPPAHADADVDLDSEEDEAAEDDRGLPGLYQRMFSRAVLGVTMDRAAHLQEAFQSFADTPAPTGGHVMSWAGVKDFFASTTILPGVVSEQYLVMLHGQSCVPPCVPYVGHAAAARAEEAAKAKAARSAKSPAGGFGRGFVPTVGGRAVSRVGGAHSTKARADSPASQASRADEEERQRTPMQLAAQCDPYDFPPLAFPQFQELLVRLADGIHVELLHAHLSRKQIALYQKLRRMHSVYTPSFITKALAASDSVAAAEREEARKRAVQASYARAAFGGAGAGKGGDAIPPPEETQLRVETSGLPTQTALSDKMNLLLDFLGFVGYDVPVDAFEAAGVASADAVALASRKLKPSKKERADAAGRAASGDLDDISTSSRQHSLADAVPRDIVRADLTSASGSRLGGGRPSSAKSTPLAGEATAPVMSDTATALRLVALAADFAVKEATAPRVGKGARAAPQNIFQSLGISPGPAPLKVVEAPPKRRTKKKGAARKPAAKPAAGNEEEDDRLENLVWEPEQDTLRSEYRQERQELLNQYREEEIVVAFGKHKPKKMPKPKKKGEVSTKKKVVKLKKLKFVEEGPLRDRYGALMPRRASELPTAAVLHFLATASGLPGSTAGHDAADSNAKAAAKARRERARIYARAMGQYKKERKAYDTEMEIVNEENEKTKKRFKFKPDSMPPLMSGPPRPSTPERPATPPPPEHQLPEFYSMLKAATRTEAALEGDGAVSGLLSNLQAGAAPPSGSDKWHPKAASLGTVLGEQKSALAALHSNSVGKRKMAKQKREIAALKELIKGIKGGTREAPVGPTGKPVALPTNPADMFKPKADAAAAGPGGAVPAPVAKKVAAKPAAPRTAPNVVASMTALSASTGAARFRPSFDARHVHLRQHEAGGDGAMHPVHKRTFGSHMQAHVSSAAWAPESPMRASGGASRSLGAADSSHLPMLSPVQRTVGSAGGGRPGPSGAAYSGSASMQPHAPHGAQASLSLGASGAGRALGSALGRSAFSSQGRSLAPRDSEHKESAPKSVGVDRLAELLLKRLADDVPEDGSSRGGDPVQAATKQLQARLAELRAELASGVGEQAEDRPSAHGIVGEVLAGAVSSARGPGGGGSGAGHIASLAARFQAPSHSLAPRTRAAYHALGLSPLVGMEEGDSSRTSGNPRFVKLAQPSGALDLAAGIAGALAPTMGADTAQQSQQAGNTPTPAYYKIPTSAMRELNSALTSERIAKASVLGTIDALGLPPAAKQAALVKVNTVKKTGKKRTVSRPGGDAYKKLLPRTYPGESYEMSGGGTALDTESAAGASITGMGSLSAISQPSKLITPAANLMRRQEAAAALQRGAGPAVLPLPSAPMAPDLAPQLLREIEAFSQESGGMPQPPQMAVIDFSAAEQYHDSGRFDAALQLYLRCLDTWLNSEELRIAQVSRDSSNIWGSEYAVSALIHGRLGSVCMSMNDAGLALKHLLVREPLLLPDLLLLTPHFFTDRVRQPTAAG